MCFFETICEYLLQLFKSFFYPEMDEYEQHNERKEAIQNPLHTPQFETHQVYPCQETF